MYPYSVRNETDYGGHLMMNYAKFAVGDVLVLKKKHPCSSDCFRVLRSGSDIRIVCLGCQRDLTLPRETLEKSIKRVITNETDGKGTNL